MTTNTPYSGQLFTLPYTQPLSSDGKIMPSCYRLFYYLNSTTLATVYQDAGLTTPYSQPITANSNGQFSPIYLNSAIEYRSQLFNSAGQLLEDCDHVNNNTAGTPYIAGYAKSAIKSTTTTQTSNTSLTADSNLSVALPCAGAYKIDLDLVCSAAASGATPGIEFCLVFTGATISAQPLPVMGTQNSAPATVLLPVSANGATPAGNGSSLGTTGISNTMRFSGTIQVLNAGTLTLYWAQQNSSASYTAVIEGSSLNVLRVA